MNRLLQKFVASSSPSASPRQTPASPPPPPPPADDGDWASARLHETNTHTTLQHHQYHNGPSSKPQPQQYGGYEDSHLEEIPLTSSSTPLNYDTVDLDAAPSTSTAHPSQHDHQQQQYGYGYGYEGYDYAAQGHQNHEQPQQHQHDGYGGYAQAHEHQYQANEYHNHLEPAAQQQSYDGYTGYDYAEDQSAPFGNADDGLFPPSQASESFFGHAAPGNDEPFATPSKHDESFTSDASAASLFASEPASATSNLFGSGSSPSAGFFAQEHHPEPVEQASFHNTGALEEPPAASLFASEQPTDGFFSIQQATEMQPSQPTDGFFAQPESAQQAFSSAEPVAASLFGSEPTTDGFFTSQLATTEASPSADFVREATAASVETTALFPRDQPQEADTTTFFASEQQHPPNDLQSDFAAASEAEVETAFTPPPAAADVFFNHQPPAEQAFFAQENGFDSNHQQSHVNDVVESDTTGMASIPFGDNEDVTTIPFGESHHEEASPSFANNYEEASIPFGQKYDEATAIPFGAIHEASAIPSGENHEVTALSGSSLFGQDDHQSNDNNTTPAWSISEPVQDSPAPAFDTIALDHQETPTWNQQEPSVTNNDSIDEVTAAIDAVSITNDPSDPNPASSEPTKPMSGTIDDSKRLAEMYKHMADRLETEKNELLQVLADQADQFYQMQDYINRLERELAIYRPKPPTQ